MDLYWRWISYWKFRWLSSTKLGVWWHFLKFTRFTSEIQMESIFKCLDVSVFAPYPGIWGIIFYKDPGENSTQEKSSQSPRARMFDDLSCWLPGIFPSRMLLCQGMNLQILSTDFVKFMKIKRRKIPWKTVNTWRKCRNVDENDLHLMKLQKPQPSAMNSQLSTTYPLTPENWPRFGRGCLYIYIYIIHLVPKP